MAASEANGPTEAGRNRRSFLRSSGGYAAGVAAVVGVPFAGAAPASADTAEGPKPRAIDHPGTAAPAEPVMAYVHDAQRGEVTVMAGTTARTYRDPALVRRLLAAANPTEKRS